MDDGYYDDDYEEQLLATHALCSLYMPPAYKFFGPCLYTTEFSE